MHAWLHEYCHTWCTLQYMYDFIEAVLTQQTSADEAYSKYEDMALPLTDHLRKLTKQVQEAHKSQHKDAIKRLVSEYDDAMERYVLTH